MREIKKKLECFTNEIVMFYECVCLIVINLGRIIVSRVTCINIGRRKSNTISYQSGNNNFYFYNLRIVRLSESIWSFFF